MYNETDDGGGVTKISVLGNDGNWTSVPKADAGNLSSDSKLSIDIFINPKQLGNDKVKIADVINHEANAHGTPFLKTLSVLREQGGAAFMKEWKSTSSVGSRDNASTIDTKYNCPFVMHAKTALGLNPNYNATNANIRSQLTPAQQKRLDAIIMNNPLYYREDIKEYNKVKSR